MIPVRCQSIKSVIYTRTTKSPEISTISGLLLYLLISRKCILGVNLVLVSQAKVKWDVPRIHWFWMNIQDFRHFKTCIVVLMWCYSSICSSKEYSFSSGKSRNSDSVINQSAPVSVMMFHTQSWRMPVCRQLFRCHLCHIGEISSAEKRWATWIKRSKNPNNCDSCCVFERLF